jgi:hypothetical protein
MLTSLLARLGFGQPQTPALAPVIEQQRVLGVSVELVNSRADISSAAVLERLEEALAMIGRYQPWRLRHLQQDVDAIRIERYACRGAFIPSERTIITELTFLARRDISAAPVASSILHEGVHARVHAVRERFAMLSGLWGPDRNAAREERLCRRAELAFGLALPAELGAPVMERALASLELDDVGVAPSVDWREAQRRIDAVDNR